jgi:histidinol-phosphate aminotransferase
MALSPHPALEITDSDTNFIYLRLKPKTSQPVNEALKMINQTLTNEGTLIRSLPGGLRITLGTPEENSRTLTRLKTALAKLEY